MNEDFLKKPLLTNKALQIVNRTTVHLAMGLRQKVVSSTEEAEEFGQIEPGGHIWLPVLRPEPGIFCLKSLGGSI